MFIVLKSFSGVDYALKSGKVISLRGGCALNEITKADFDELLLTYPKVSEAIESGYIVVSGNKDIAQKQSNKAIDDTKQETLNKQEKAQEKIKNATNTELKRESTTPKGKK